jgi:hypothetical protein
MVDTCKYSQATHKYSILPTTRKYTRDLQVFILVGARYLLISIATGTDMSFKNANPQVQVPGTHRYVLVKTSERVW